ncbi:L-aminoadipate-semialdehyde dehydrogenase-phosphopantetheinyl transferase [Myotis brandtii]|uniref:L-aminoadipate-semialdehyde dehydrogenase-phosphopantetheinyl transferase n=1 Tax=Myotis brandtii TaxID=109478 RepID=S7MU79_MYOBR|nr:L-aminoadipate-semialdehyde dehydrogenase-phosphopantetheinyl transferase [Myotis brandtii]
MIRKLITEKLNIPWNNIRLQRTAKGKPVLAKDSLNPYPNFNFNISHQGDYAVLAAEPELQVGIDIMKTSFPGRGSISEFFHIMKRKFTNKEWETIKSFKDEWTQLDMFYRNWALKESFIKAIGVGLGFELQRLEFDMSPLNLDLGQVYKETRLFLDGKEEKEWAFEESKIDEHHFVAVALRKPDGSRHQDASSQDDSKPSQRQFTILTYNDLISSAVPMTPEDPSFWDCFCFTEEILIRNGGADANVDAVKAPDLVHDRRLLRDDVWLCVKRLLGIGNSKHIYVVKLQLLRAHQAKEAAQKAVTSVPGGADANVDAVKAPDLVHDRRLLHEDVWLCVKMLLGTGNSKHIYAVKLQLCCEPTKLKRLPREQLPVPLVPQLFKTDQGPREETPASPKENI